MLGAPRQSVRALRVAHHPDELVPELLPRGAVQEEVHRVVHVHQQLGDGARQAELGDALQVVLEDVTEGGGDVGDVHRQRREQEGERDRQQHDGEPRVALVRRPTLLRHASTAATAAAAAQLADAGRAKFVAVVSREKHLTNDESVEGDDEGERQERVDHRVHPRPDVLHDVGVAFYRRAHAHRHLAVFELSHLDRPEEVRVEREHGAQKRDDDLLGALRVAQTVRLERVTHDDVALDGDGDDEPHAEVAHRVADDVCQFAQPVGSDQDVVTRQLADPQAQQADVKDKSVSQGEDHQVEVGGELEHRLPLEDDEREDVAECTEENEDGRHVEEKGFVQLVLGVLGEIIVVTLRGTERERDRVSYIRLRLVEALTPDHMALVALHGETHLDSRGG